MRATKKPRKSHEKGPNTVFPSRCGPRKSHGKAIKKSFLITLESQQDTSHKGETHPRTIHPNKSTVCANNFGTVCTNSPPFFRQFPRVTSIGSLPPKTLGKSREPPQNPGEPRRTLGETPEPSERPPQSPLRGKFPRRASRRVLPLGW